MELNAVLEAYCLETVQRLQLARLPIEKIDRACAIGFEFEYVGGEGSKNGMPALEWLLEERQGGGLL
jgi:hypothetical protein